MTLSPLVLFYTLFRLYCNPSYFAIDTSLIPCLTPLTPLANAQALLQRRAAPATTEKSCNGERKIIYCSGTVNNSP